MRRPGSALTFIGKTWYGKCAMCAALLERSKLLSNELLYVAVLSTRPCEVSVPTAWLGAFDPRTLDATCPGPGNNVPHRSAIGNNTCQDSGHPRRTKPVPAIFAAYRRGRFRFSGSASKPACPVAARGCRGVRKKAASIPRRVQVPNNHILTQNLYNNYYYQNPRYL